MEAPLLLIVAGPPGSGKTTLSRQIGDVIGLPVVCRDAIKEGVTHTAGTVTRHGTPEASRLFGLFYDVVDSMLRAGISLIAEAAFRRDIAPDELASRAEHARLMLVRCVVAPDLWFERFKARGERPGHRDDEFVARTLAAGGPTPCSADYQLELPGVPTLDVDTTNGYAPTLGQIAEFVRTA